MAKIKIEGVMEYLDNDIRKALKETLEQHFPGQHIDISEVFRTFVRTVGRSTWHNIPDRYLEP